jgi:hypothetical protein
MHKKKDKQEKEGEIRMPALGKLNPNRNRIQIELQIEKNNHHKYVITTAKKPNKKLIKSWTQERCVGKTRVPD